MVFQHSFFSTGCSQTALAIAEVLRQDGHTVVFLKTAGEESKNWWDDCKTLAESWTVVSKGSEEARGLDILLEIDKFTLSVDDRIQLNAKRGVWLMRKNPILSEIEASLYPTGPGERPMDRISEIWIFKEFSTQDDIEYLETLTQKPVVQVPFVWTPSGVEFHRKESQAPVWSQVYDMKEFKTKPWSIHICETNNSNTSSCTIPLFIARDLRRSTGISFDPVIKVHNAEHVARSEFFRFNVLQKVFSDIPDMSGSFIGRQRIVDFVYDPKCCLIGHSRFIPIRPYLLDALWVGLPMIHNSKLLAGIGGEAATGFYPDNEILEARRAFERVVIEKTQEGGLERLLDTRRRLLERFSPYVPVIREAYGHLLRGHLDLAVPAAPTAVAPPSSVSTASGFSVTVGFCDMWDEFNPEYNPFTLILQASLGSRGTVRGVAAGGAEKLDLVVFGPFGTEWEKLPKTIPKVHYTGENTPSVVREDVLLNLGFEHKNNVDESYLRLPLWMLEINWFRADVEKLGNPKPIPIDSACKVNMSSAELERKKKFCAFIVTNPRQPIRNAAFHWLSEYKSVDSAGRLFNNMGDKIFAGLGGGGGELKKLEFLKDYRFCLAYENESSPGYCTEKYLHAKAAGCVPIYWGDPKAERDFNMEGCVDARAITNAADLQKAVRELEENPEAWKAKVAIPALDEVHRDLVRRTLSECGRRMLKLAGAAPEILEAIPRFLGETQDSEDKSAPATPAAVTETNVSFDSTIFVTACNSKFLPSLTIWLKSVLAQKSVVTELGVVVYMMEDISNDVKDTFAQEFSFAQFRRFPTDAPALAGFPDFWAPEHFAWKIWLLHHMCHDEGIAGRPVMYMDTGVFMCRWPRDWLNEIRKYGISMLEDEQQISAHWCHKESQVAMKMTEEELKSYQIFAGICSFVAGHPLATKLFDEGLKWANQKSVIAGPKWAGVASDGKRFGHRHDQSILSILAHRMKLHRYPLYKLYCDISLRQTFMKKACFYVHRGNFTVHTPFLPKIDDVWVINLDRRADRLESFYKANPGFDVRSLRLPAFDGRSLQLTPRLARLFAPHDFNWKKSVMGCALSHLALWTQLMNDNEDIKSYLICEDDARLKPGWKEAWTKAEPKLPEGWDIVYLGGILPPNREAFEQMGIEPVAEGIGRVAKNRIFGQQEANRYMHFCAYAYVITRQGAMKVLEVLKAHGGYWTSADHMICNIHDLLNIYFLNPLVAGCFQDEDPVYCQSAFNDFSRKDSFDSDLWNNTETFSLEEVKKHLNLAAPLDILGALEDARAPAAPAAPATPAATEPAPAQPPTHPLAQTIGCEAREEAKQELVKTIQKSHIFQGKRRLLSIGKPEHMKEWYEGSWLEDILFHNAGISLDAEAWMPGDEEPTDAPIVVVNRANIQRTLPVLEAWNNRGIGFYVLHLSDEFCNDPVFWYSWPNVLGVIRNYVREDAPDTEKVRTIPLGWHWALSQRDPRENTPRPPFRQFAWSFIGTNWAGRGEKLAVLEAVPGDKKCVMMKEWNSPESLGREEVIGIYLNSWFVPCPGGQNAETFRIYEALEAGAIPIFVKEGDMEPLFKQIGSHMPILIAENWQQAAAIIHTLKNAQPEKYDEIRTQILNAWVAWKEDIRATVRKIFQVQK